MRHHGTIAKVGWVTSGTCTWGGMVGWKGATPKSSHHQGLARCQEKGKKEWSAGAAYRKILQAHHIAVGGGVNKAISGVHLDVGVPRLPHRVIPHRVEELVNTGGERGQMEKFEGGELVAQFPPQGCGPSPPPR